MRKNTWQTDRAWAGLETMESRLLLAADLAVQIGATPGLIPAGFTFNVPVLITNSVAPVSGTGTITVSLLEGGVDVHDWTETVNMKFSGVGTKGSQRTFKIPVTIPTNLDMTKTHQFQVTVTPPNPNLTTETPVREADIRWRFGNINATKGSTSLIAVDPKTGNTGTFSLKGPGYGELFLDNGMWDLLLTNTTRATKITIAGSVGLEVIYTDYAVGSIIAPNVDLLHAAGHEANSGLYFAQGLASLTMHDSDPEDGTAHLVTIGKADKYTNQVSITFHNAQDIDIQSQMPIKSFTAAELVAHNTLIGAAVFDPQIHSTAYIGSVNIAGDFRGDITLGVGTCVPVILADSSQFGHGTAIGSVQIGGAMFSAKIDSEHGDLGNVAVGKGLDQGATMYANHGNVQSVKVAANVDNGSLVYTDGGSVLSAQVGGNLDNASKIYAANGSLGKIAIAGNVGVNCQIYAGGAAITSLFIGKDVGAGVQIWAATNLTSLNVAGSVVGTAGSRTSIYAQNMLGMMTITGDATDTDIYSNNSINKITVAGSLTDSTINAYFGGSINSIIVGALNNAVIAVDASSTPVGTTADFTSQSSYLGSLVVTGALTVIAQGPPPTTGFAYMINNSKILAWGIGSISFGADSVGSGLIEYHMLYNILHKPTAVVTTQV